MVKCKSFITIEKISKKHIIISHKLFLVLNICINLKFHIETSNLKICYLMIITG